MENLSDIITKEDQHIDLPPGFRFHPTDEELITHYLSQKVLDSTFIAGAIAEVDLNKCEPWDLPWRAKMGEKEWYFFCIRDRKYPTGLRTNRATDSGYWKATGKDREIFRLKTLVGMKKTLVFYKGRAPKGEKTNWVMHEYRLEGKYYPYNNPKMSKNEWVICRVFQKNSGGKKVHISGLVRLPPLMDSSKNGHVTCFSNSMEDKQKTEENSEISQQNSVFPSQIDCNLENFQYPESVFLQEESILRILVENNGSNIMKSSLKTEFSQEFDAHDHQDDEPSTSVGPVDLDCLWNY